MEMPGDTKRLHPATRGDIDKIKDKLKEYFPKSSVIYGTLSALAAYEGLWDLLETQLYYSDQSSLVVGTASVHKNASQSLYLFWDEDNEDDEEIVHLLSAIPTVNWNRPISLKLVDLSLVRRMDKFVTSGSLGNGVLKPNEPMSTVEVYSMPSVPIVDMTLPNGFELRDLTEEHAEFIREHWQYKHAIPLDSYRLMRKILPGIGVFKTGDGNDSEMTKMSKEPVAWAQLSFYNMYTHTFTLPQYRRLGLASVATLALAKRSLELTGVALSAIGLDNQLSINMHVKLGFKRITISSYRSYN
ncbi:uncharacterized protein [Palaemon carinicauda]|uniref:uncharacterized protein isoform X4 n=1 Tax=Palaemon carinicauda TaxID=392227 RepID=UPI0035B5AF70